MKFKDIYTSLNRDINLKRFHPKINIKVESFDSKQKKIDLTNTLKHTLDSSGNKNFILSNLDDKQKSFDSLFRKKTLFINISPRIKKRFKLGHIKSKLIFLIEQTNLLFKSSKIFKYGSILFFIFILILFNKFLVEYNTNAGYKKLLSISNSTHKKSIVKTIKSAHSNFILARALFTPFRLISNDKINNAHYIIKGGEQITNMTLKSASFFTELSTLIKNKSIGKIMFSQFLLNNKHIFQDLEKSIISIEDTYSNIKFTKGQIKENIRLEILKEKIKQAKFYSYTFNNNFNEFLEILGHSKRKKYLIAFQNNDEIRASGGFMGSLAIVEIFRGQVKKFTKNDVYFYEFKIKKEQFKKEISPEGINKISTFLGLRDANYFINNKDSSDKIRFFMKKAGYPIDGIIYINMNSLTKILNLVGEFDSKILSRRINAHNFSSVMSLLVEAKISQKSTTDSPKEILFKFIDEFQEVLQKRNISKIQILKILLSEIKTREITLYSFNNNQRKLLESMSLYNPIDYESSLDFSYPVFTSISGNKSDRYIEHSYQKIITKGKQCSYHTSFTTLLNHTFGDKDENNIKTLAKQYNIELKQKEKDLLFIQGKGLNKQYVRVILPKEAQVQNKNVTIIDYENRGKSVGFYMNTPVGREGSFTLNYTLPNKECKTYNYKLFKQPGIRNYDIIIDKFGEKIEFLNNKKDVYIN